MAVTATSNERFFSSWKHVIGDKRTRMRVRRQTQCVRWYVNKRVLDKMKQKDWKEPAYESDSEAESENEAEIERELEG